MAETKVKFAADVAIVVANWSTGLADGESALSAVIDNSVNLFLDALVGGKLAASTLTGGPIVAGDSLDVYVLAQYSDTDEDIGGAIDALLGWGNEEAVDVAFVKANLTLLQSVQVQATAPDTTQDLHFGPIGIAQFFGGVLPKKWGLLLHNNTAATLGAGSDANYIGITYSTV